MNKFIIKFTVLFAASMAVVFFALILFQGHQMPPVAPANMPGAEFAHYGLNQPEAPPIYIPCLLIVLLSTLFIFCILKHINKNFIIPLMSISENLKQIKKGNLNIVFKTESENSTINKTFSTLNDMVMGLKQKEKLQENFIQNLTHDLRAPMIAQERAISVLQDEFEGHELLDCMMKNSETYLKMINLIIEAYSEKKVIINKSECKLFEIVNNIFKVLMPMAQEKQITLENEIPNNLIIWCDYISITRIITNLISNSIEHIGVGKKINIKAENSNGKIQIIITDNGQGIKEADIDKIFNKYYSQSNTGKKAVSGLGLYIVKDLITQNDGDIFVKSKENEYTQFIIEFKIKDNNE